MKVFMISDTHFGDERILRYENRPFSSVEEMDKAISENWNQVVGEEDMVFHLGDVSSYDPERNKEILSSLHGKKILVMGNHDQNYTSRQWEEMGFDQAINYPILFREFFHSVPYTDVYLHKYALCQFLWACPRKSQLPGCQQTKCMCLCGTHPLYPDRNRGTNL